MDKFGDLCDWEVLQNSDASDSAGEEELGEQQLVFQSDYFSLDSPHQNQNQKPPSSDDGSSAVSDNPSWIDPASDVPFPPRTCADFWLNDGDDEDDDDDDDKLESSGNTKYWSDSTEAFNLDYKNEGLEAQADTKIGLGFDSCGLIQHQKDANNSDASTHDEDADDGGSNSNRNLVIEELKPAEKKEEESARVLWWKLPLDLLKYCVLRVSPIWSLSVAAALVGFVILGRRLYKMKRKNKGLQLKVIIDDKRVSQFRIHAARLNEAFSLVRRVPIIRPSLPAPGAAPWPVMSMR